MAIVNKTIPTCSKFLSSNTASGSALKPMRIRNTVSTNSVPDPWHLILLFSSVTFKMPTTDGYSDWNTGYLGGGWRSDPRWRAAWAPPHPWREPSCSAPAPAASAHQKQRVISSSVADPWHFGVDPYPDPRIHASDEWIRIRIRDPDPAIFVIDLQDASKKQIFLTQLFLLFTFWRYIYIIFQR